MSKANLYFCFYSNEFISHSKQANEISVLLSFNFRIIYPLIQLDNPVCKITYLVISILLYLLQVDRKTFKPIDKSTFVI
ncbi:hypothetical protein BCE_2351 [Bacillus cereus ATCC 10987]|uniref:Uncharacterized protein n=1 Tax=Bacillus cereus (strain ATCC 10987 / NRS 248) TaxID=222523 RepID=Q738P3_BACC1|nr:hypothetical protein BCE_2351 [Bacillus cereus ATCC 10987]